MKTYSTSEVAKLVGLHPNTIRKYEEWHLIPQPKRRPNGYRIYTNYHVNLIKITRIAFAVEIIHANLRKKIIEVIRSLADYNFSEAAATLRAYLDMIAKEKLKAKEAIDLVNEELQQSNQLPPLALTRKQAADYLEITIDTLRNWELNGLIDIPRQTNRYRLYDEKALATLKIIRTLRNANYSLSAILRFLQVLKANNSPVSHAEIQQILNELSEAEYLHSVCDTLLVSLNKAEKNAQIINGYLGILKENQESQIFVE